MPTSAGRAGSLSPMAGDIRARWVQALAALLFLYREVLNVELPWIWDIQRARASGADTGGAHAR